VTSAKSQPPAFTGTGTGSTEPSVVIDGDLAVWITWADTASGQVFYQRFRKDLTPPDWETSSTPVPGAFGGSPNGARDATGAVWLFWARSGAAGRMDIFLARDNPVTGGWGEPRQLIGSTEDDLGPFPLLAPDGKLWLFWDSFRAVASTCTLSSSSRRSEHGSRARR
jgi:hypothetical protein